MCCVNAFKAVIKYRLGKSKKYDHFKLEKDYCTHNPNIALIIDFRFLYILTIFETLNMIFSKQ